MRDLEFRAYIDENGQKSFEHIDLNAANADELARFHAVTNNHGVVKEQYTGLKDKNGHKIYEGDIVEALIDGVWNTGTNTVSFGKAIWKLEVVYDNVRFMDVFKIIGSKSNPDRIYYLFDKELSEIKVIGNIHENKELLERSKENESQG